MSEDFSERQTAIFRLIVETYLETGAPVGSRTIAKGGISLSPASIRSVMADLEEAGLLYAPYTSAGRLPTERGLRLFVDGLLEVGNLTAEERKKIEAECRAKNTGFEAVLEQATALLSGLSHCAGVVSVPKQNAPLKHIEFLDLGSGRGLAILVFASGGVENRVIDIPPGLPPAALLRAANYLNARIEGRTLEEVRNLIERELAEERAELDALTQKVIAAGLARRSGAAEERETLIVRGQAHLLEALDAAGDLERIRRLFEDLERKQDFLKLLETAKRGEGVRIFIGAENKLFSLSGSSVIVSPYRNEAGKMVGAIGIIGPTRINYARIIPLVDYTARVVSRLI